MHCFQNMIFTCIPFDLSVVPTLLLFFNNGLKMTGFNEGIPNINKYIKMWINYAKQIIQNCIISKLNQN